jgi:hypothetical protein
MIPRERDDPDYYNPPEERVEIEDGYDRDDDIRGLTREERNDD